ncbi:lipopolysaccharide biosynthesis protein [Sediminicoccus rosea]|uniref:Lipopolysaccharide biosynthesis protein n=1 Tax=Sediminicoccus rosea TaxID=1225128 RepID=A0ABZ0PE86_9PROT|nr:lipopolysaccharide biosynthesis protein [Sediminicoccus rosea]WPB83586.1 lipopolysaccharide biosynthesis protein [Sediminicoccus rosea]
MPKTALHALARLPAPLRAAALYAVAIAWTKALSLLLLPLLTGYLEPAEFARLELLSSAAEIAALLAGAGLVDTLYRFASSPGREGMAMAARVLGLGVLLAGLGLIIAVLLAPAGALLPLPAPPIEVTLLGAAVAMEAVIGVPLAWMRMQGRALAWSVVMVVRGTAQAGLAAALLWSGYGVAGVLAAGAVAAGFTALLLVLRQSRETGLALEPRIWPRLLVYGLPLTGGGLASFALGTADRWLLAGAVTPEALAHYALAAKIAMVSALLTQPFELWWYPRRIGLLEAEHGHRQTTQVVGMGGALVVLAAAGTALGGPVLIQLATPPAYHAAVSYLPWLCAALAMQSLGSLVNVGCYMGRTGALPMLVNGAAGVVAILAYLVLIPSHGVMGAIIATLLAQGVRLGLFLWFSQRRVRLDYRLGRLAILSALCILALGLPLPLGAILLGLGCIPFAMALGLLPAPRLPQRQAMHG